MKFVILCALIYFAHANVIFDQEQTVKELISEANSSLPYMGNMFPTFYMDIYTKVTKATKKVISEVKDTNCEANDTLESHKDDCLTHITELVREELIMEKLLDENTDNFVIVGSTKTTTVHVDDKHAAMFFGLGHVMVAVQGLFIP